jgi:hypothetical protein
MSWFRWWEGTVTDPKWRVVAARSMQPVGNVLAVWAYVLEEARRLDGALPELDCEVIGACLGYDPDAVASIIAGMKAKGSIDEQGVTNWRKRQPKREDDSRERVAAYREKKRLEAIANARPESVTHGNAPEAEAEAEEVLEFYPDTLSPALTFVGSQANATDPRQDKPKASGKPPTGKRNAYPEAFEEFWQGYPTDANMSKKEAYDVWKRISAENRQLATDSLPAFRAHCASNPDYRPIHACRYLAKERFVGHVAMAKKIEAQRFIEQGTPQWDAWQRHLKAARGKGSPIGSGTINGRSCQGWTFPSEWPPSNITTEHRQERNAA